MSRVLYKLQKQPKTIARRFALLLLLSLLVLFGSEKEAILLYLINLGQDFLTLLNITEATNHSTYKFIAYLKPLSYKAIKLGYNICYAGLSVLIIHFYTNKLAISKIAVGVYIFLFSIFILLYGVAILSQNLSSMMAAIRVEELITSPLVILLFIPAIYLLKSKPSNVNKEEV